MEPTCPICHSFEVLERYPLSPHSGYRVFQCRDCSLQFLHPQPSDQELAEIYTDTYYQSWGFDGRESPIVERMKQKTFTARLKLISNFKPRGRILDLGCATGYFLDLAAQFGFQPFGVEISRFSGELAQKKLGAENIFIGTIEDCPFPQHHFDIITMSDFLEHVKNPELVFNKASTLLKEDGMMVLATPATDSFTCKLMKARWTHYKQEHVIYLNQKSLERLARLTGFAIVERRRCLKAVNLFYLFHQFRTYPHWLFTPLSRLFRAVFPLIVLSANFCIPMGESVFFLRKQKTFEC